MKIKDLPRVDRPREKLIKYGPGKLSNSELLAILLGTGIKGINVVELSNKILKKFTGNNLAKADVKELKNITGLGEAKACEIVACFELGKRLLKEKKAELILSPEDVWEQLKDIRNHKKEHFVVFYLDTRNQEICREIISIGTLNESLVHPREVFEPAIRNSAAQIIIAHNHPSGNPDPSEEDIKITAKLVEAGKLLGIELFDHIIVTKEDFFSMSKENLL
ncbi:MAG: DNA repair protein RadC [Candidatus Daviesbacteria bacterium]|nr:DNA repair protein RadC [Candidatus Daviesbacteria bacterium]